MDGLELPLDALVRSVGVSKGTSQVFLLGAGASITSGVPSADRCIWEWKRDIFLSNNPGLEDQFAELSLPAVREKIQRWIDRQGGFPREGAPEEYGFYIERCFPISEHRRSWFQAKVQAARPHVGYKALCALAQAALVDSVWSTNFDQLTVRAASDFDLTPIEVGLDTQHRVERQPRLGELLVVALHGDYRYDHLRNTEPELREQDERLRNELIERIQNRPLLVVGYSGRDESVMSALREAYSRKNPGALYWCTYGETDVPAAVADLVAIARAHGRTAYVVPAFGFDDLLSRLGLRCLEGTRFETIRSMALGALQGARDRAPFSVEDVSSGALIKSNAFEVQCPGEVYEFELSEWPSDGVWAWLREKTGGHEVVAVPFRGRVLCLGAPDSIKAAFGDLIKGSIARTPVSEQDLRLEDGAVTSLLLSGLVRAMASRAGLATDGIRRVWDERVQERRSVDGQQFEIRESAVAFLRRIGQKQYLALKPSVDIRDSSGSAVDAEVEHRVRMNVLGWQHNAKFNQAMERWRRRFFPEGGDRFFYPPDVAGGFPFDVRRVPIFAALQTHEGGRAAKIPESIRRHVRHFGFELEEPKLLFSAATGTRSHDVHPIRGVLNNRPYDFALTQRGIAPSVRLAVICPSRDSARLAAFLQRSRDSLEPLRTERDYLLDFPGFEAAFGLPLELPEPGSPGWLEYVEPPAAMDSREGALSIARSVTAAIDALRASHWPCIALVYVPDRLKSWRGFESEDECFDVHDFVKAHCVARGITSQFLNEHTLTEQQQCRVWWWLSLAFYVKSMRTPWVLDGLESDTAYVGLGFSIDPRAERGRHVVLGCSHLYNSRGEGLQYRLTKIEDPIIRRGNPFLSRDDARRVGETIRQLFYEARTALPSRVVIHKRTAYQRDEREGLLEGLGGVDEVDMLEINVDPALRYVSSVVKSGRFDEDNYPVERGSVVKLDTHNALLWVHGVAGALSSRFRYYQGKRRIPAPLVVRRHVGRGDLRLVCSEILGLSKMDWNNFDLYTKLPSTLESSGRIARIGSLLERFGATAYDYRLFI
jgi:hypothetical protein